MHLRFVISTSTDPFLNVAVENYLLSLPDDDIVTLYLWKNHRTVVIGKHQNPFSECNVELLESEGGHLMRRSTGGGAVYHDDGNLNFSFVVPTRYYDQQRQFSVLQRAVASYGLATELSGRNDVLCCGRKFSGNAFARGKSQRLHHGTILIAGDMESLQRYLRVKASKLQKHGVASVQSRVVNLSELAPITSVNIVPRLLEAFNQVYCRSTDGTPEDHVICQESKSYSETDHNSNEPDVATYSFADQPAQELSFEDLKENTAVQQLRTNFVSDEWRFGPWRNFQAQKTAQFQWGGVELSVDVDDEHGILRSVEIATDSLQPALIDQLKQLLRGASTKQPPQLSSTFTPDQHQIAEDIFSLIY